MNKHFTKYYEYFMYNVNILAFFYIGVVGHLSQDNRIVSHKRGWPTTPLYKEVFFHRLHCILLFIFLVRVDLCLRQICYVTYVERVVGT